jgi:uncharacterized membrane protein YkvA (DUF1232 family)
MKLLQKLREKARHLNTEIYALYLAYKHPQVSWAAKIIIAITIGYALSPIDLIPDFVPVFGFLDDLLIVPAGIALSVRLIPVSVLQECRAKALELFQSNKPKLRYAWMIVFFTWLLIAAILAMLFYKFLHEPKPSESL